MTPPLMTFVIVSYGGVDDAVRLVGSLGAREAVDIVLCANKPGDTDAAERAFADDTRVRVLAFEDNPGYLPALQRALPHVDTSAPGGAVQLRPGRRPRAGRRAARAGAGVPGCRVAGARRHREPRCRPEPQPPRAAVGPLARALSAVHRFPGVADLLLLREEGHSSRTLTGVEPGAAVFAGHGSVIVLTPRFFAAGGSCDYPFALFGEELWFARECARLGLEVRYVPSAVLRHTEHAATGHRRRGAVARVKYDGLRYWARAAAEAGW